MAVSAGDLTRRLAVLNPVESTDERRSTKLEWLPDGPAIWGKIEPMSGAELEIGDVRQGIVTHKITVYETSRVRFRTVLEETSSEAPRRFEVVSRFILEERDRYLELRCKEAE